MAPSGIVSGSTPPETPAAASPPGPPEQRCPRCGGLARARPRRPTAGNPFLSKKESSEITCDDCGLDFPPPGAAPEPSHSKSSPWGKP